MIGIGDLNKKIERLYGKVLSAYVAQQQIFPLVIEADKSLPDDFASWTKALEEIIAHSADRKQFGYCISYETKQTRKHGMQSVPVQFRFNDRNQLLGYLNKQAEFEMFSNMADTILQTIPRLKGWLSKNSKQVIEYHASWPGLIKVIQYFEANHMPQLFARELPIAVHTKFIEQHKSLLYALLNEVLPAEAINNDFAGVHQFEQRFGLRTASKRIRMRILDYDFARTWAGGFTDIELTIEELAKSYFPLQRVIVLENKKNFENADIFCSMPDIHGTAVLFGSGKAAALLAQLGWLQNTQMLYWGDIDAEGFEILNMLRSYFPHIQSIFMDAETFDSHQQFITKGNQATLKPLNKLQDAEWNLYEFVCIHERRLEQELLFNDFVVLKLRSL
jgi:hypothetical protein